MRRWQQYWSRSTPVMTDRAALVALYKATDGDNWNNNTNWNTDAPLGQWHGVEVNGQGLVVELKLGGNNLKGHIPRQLGDLGALQHLGLSNNKLDGPIPPELGKLAALKELYLYDNQLSGPIPPELGNLSNLQELYLSGPISGGGLTGRIPPELGKLAALEELSLGWNQLSGPIPKELGALSALRDLRLYSNQLSGHIPPQLGQLGALQYLGLSRNKLDGPIPPELGNLAALEILNLELNGLSGPIPPELGKLTALQKLNLWKNQLSGPIPPELGNLAALQYLDLDDNKLSGPIPPELGKLSALTVLKLWSNQLTGPIPPELGKLTALKELDLSKNQLTVISRDAADALRAIKSLRSTNFARNRWRDPPPGVVEQGLDAICRYHEAIERSQSKPSWTIKVVLVGAVCAGKSSVVESLVAGEPRLVPLETRTRGVDVHIEQPFKPDASKPVELVFWDFAGHDDYHSTHSLFLSGGALFLLVVDLPRFLRDPSSRSDAIHIWLDTLLLQTPGAVVQIVATHVEGLSEQDKDNGVGLLRQAVVDHLVAKEAEYKRGWPKSGGEGEMPPPPRLQIIFKVHPVSCKEGDDWPDVGKELANLAADGTTKRLRAPSAAGTSSEGSGQKEDKLFPSMGQNVPVIWARATGAMDALRDGMDPVAAATLESSRSSVTKPRVRYLHFEDAVQAWEDVAASLGLSDEIGPEGARSVLKDAIRLKQREGMLLLENGLLHLDPTWINDLLSAILDHRLQDPTEHGFWEEELTRYADCQHSVDFDKLVNAHETFCATGTLTVSYLRFLWREVTDIDREGFFDRLLDTMRNHGVLFSGSGGSSAGGDVTDGGSSTELFVPVRLDAYIDKKKLEKFAVPCLLNEWRRQLVFRIWQSYVPSGVVGMLMSRLLGTEGVQFHCAWSRGISFMMGGSEVLLFLNAPTTHGDKAEIEVNIVGPKRTDEVEVKVNRTRDIVKDVLSGRFPGLLFNCGQPQSVEGPDALMAKIETLEAHLDVRLDGIDGKLDEVALSSRKSLLHIQNLQAPNFPYPHLVVIREHLPSGGTTARSGGKKRIHFKARLQSIYSRARALGKKEMRLQFLCPVDFSPVPCGADGEGYRLDKTDDWVKKVFPVLQLTAVIAKVALRAVSGLDLEVSDFLNAFKDGIGGEIADRLDEDTLDSVVRGQGIATEGMQIVSKASYEALKKFMEKGQHVDFKNHMELVEKGKDGIEGMVWVSKKNKQRWLDSQSMAPSA